jgi:hypothetical protein
LPHARQQLTTSRSTTSGSVVNRKSLDTPDVFEDDDATVSPARLTSATTPPFVAKLAVSQWLTATPSHPGRILAATVAHPRTAAMPLTVIEACTGAPIQLVFQFSKLLKASLLPLDSAYGTVMSARLAPNEEPRSLYEVRIHVSVDTVSSTVTVGVVTGVSLAGVSLVSPAGVVITSALYRGDGNGPYAAPLNVGSNEGVHGCVRYLQFVQKIHGFSETTESFS